MRIQAERSARTGFGPGRETAARESLLANPKSLAVVTQTLDGVATPRTEYKERAAQRVAGEHLPTECRQAVDALAEVNGLDRHEDPHLRGDLDHRWWCRKACTSGNRSSGLASGRRR